LKGTLHLVRLSPELTIKARGTRQRFTRRLTANLRDALTSTGEPFEVEGGWTRLYFRSAAPDAALVAARVPGISSVSPVEATCAASLPEIVRTGAELFHERVLGRSYAVRAKRTGRHPFSSEQIQRELGAALNPGARVDLGSPDVEVEVEVRDETAYFFSQRVAGCGGLPLAAEGRALCLISGGFDSAVAAWMMLRRGVTLDYVFCNLAGGAYERSVVQVAKILADDWSYGTQPRLHVVDFTAVLDELRRTSPPRYWQIVLKRLMYRAAQGIAGNRVSGLVTGEAIGQVSSQTLVNLRAIEGAATLPVFRPLIAFDKNEIIDRARRIGTYAISAKVKEHCAIAPGHPATHASAAAIRAAEEGFSLEVLWQALRERRTLELRQLSAADLVSDYLYADTVPTAAEVIDLRTPAEWEAWHYPGAENREIWELLANFRKLDAGGTYLLYCAHGLQAAQVADAMQKEGYEAYAYRGGARPLRESAGVPAGSAGE
jgi:tRNA uracil 4-sulfurtransferase